MTSAVHALVDAPWGAIHVAASDRGIVALDLMAPTEGFLNSLRRRGHEIEGPGAPARRESRHDLLERVVTALRAYLGGEPERFELPLDLGTRPDWDRAVLDGVRGIPWGAVSSYGRVARRIGRPGAARAVGGAVGRNAIGILIPCHRVIAGDGSLGGYGGAWYGTREALLAVKRKYLRWRGSGSRRSGWKTDPRCTPVQSGASATSTLPDVTVTRPGRR